MTKPLRIKAGIAIIQNGDDMDAQLAEYFLEYEMHFMVELCAIDDP